MNYGLQISLGVAIALAVSACGMGQGALTSSEPVVVDQPMNPFDVNRYNLGKLICDPFDNERPPVGFDAGLQAELYYLKPGQERFNSVTEYIQKAKMSEQDLFFSEVNVPTRLFDTGFPLEIGDLIKNDSGEVLFEYFALRMKSKLKLSEGQPPGHYELAVLSDDGSILKIKEEGEYVTYVDNDGDHPTKFGCGDGISMEPGKSHEIELSYYQGPRFHISVIPMWRRVDESGPQGDPLCGKKGNRKFFDYKDNSKPLKAYHDLLSRGWKPIAADNYELPTTSGYNPCAGEREPEITDLFIFDVLDGGVQVVWKTDIPATSQVMYTSDRTQQPITTVSDNILRTEHSVMIPDPESGESLIIRAISISDTLGKTISSGRIYRKLF